jgi:endogenous inhibitor of DNA gyrase (YacG/DUF329 family)
VTRRAASPAAPVVSCPGCRRPTTYTPANRWRPFCSERCKVGDLGAWASDAYVIPGAASEDDDSSDMPAANRTTRSND